MRVPPVGSLAWTEGVCLKKRLIAPALHCWRVCDPPGTSSREVCGEGVCRKTCLESGAAFPSWNHEDESFHTENGQESIRKTGAIAEICKLRVNYLCNSPDLWSSSFFRVRSFLFRHPAATTDTWAQCNWRNITKIRTVKHSLLYLAWRIKKHFPKKVTFRPRSEETWCEVRVEIWL